MPPFWKIKREATRFAKQLAETPQLILGPWRRRRYDAARATAVSTWDGEHTLGAKVAVVLIYQPDGLLPSLEFMLTYLISNGFSIVLVANHPLDAAATEQLKPFCAKLIARPNIGYDFGGYREGILSLKDTADIDNLIILNDSIWFPLHKDCTILREALDDPSDIFGIFRNTKSKRAEHHNLQSYFYRFKGHLLRHPGFLEYWRTIPFHNDKRMVIRHLEVAFTGRMEALGFSIGTKWSPEDVVAAGSSLSEAELQDVAAYHVSSTRRGEAAFASLARLTPSHKDWPAVRTQTLQDSRFKFYFIDAHPLVLLAKMGAPFLKKSREYHYARQREELFRLKLESHLDPALRAEIAAWDQDGRVGPPENSAYPPLRARSSKI